MNRMNHVHHNEHPRSKNNSTASLLGITAVFVLLGCGGIYYAMSGSGMQTKATTPVVRVDTSIATARPDLPSERSPAANEPITPTPTPAPRAPKTPPSR
jgi:hypothetical protein